MRKASLSSKDKLLVVLGFFLGMTFTAVVFMLPWTAGFQGVADAIGHVQERQEEKDGLSYWRKRVARVDYEDAEPGDIVEWCVDNTGSVSYYSGKPSQPLIWEDRSKLPNGGVTSGGRCSVVLAKVIARKADGLLLSYIGRP